MSVMILQEWNQGEQKDRCLISDLLMIKLHIFLNGKQNPFLKYGVLKREPA